MNQNERITIFEKMPPVKAAFNQMLPAIASQLVILAYNLTDTYFVGLLNAPVQTSALQVVYPAFTMLNAVSALFGTGGAAVVARALGKKEHERAAALSSIAFWTGLVGSILLSVAFLLAGKTILPICGATPENLAISMQYATFVITVGGPFAVCCNVLSSLVKSQGEARVASIGISFGAILNIVLDPFFVLPRFLGMGAGGAGLATAISNAAGVLFFVVHLTRTRETRAVQFSLSYLKQTGKLLGDVLSSGAPTAILNALAVIAVAAQTHFVSKYQVEATAALGIIKKLDQIPLYVALGIGAGILPILAYNYASGNKKRCHDIFRIGCLFSVGFCTLCTVLYELAAPQLCSIFIKNETTVTLAASFIRRMVLAMPFMAFCNPVVNLFQASRRIKFATIITLIRKGVLDIPLLALMDHLIPLYGCMWVQPIVDFTAMVVTIILYIKFRKEEPDFR